ncbi:L-alanine-DL-glutamate epimerase-like enolase superfamily enzyme [Pseudoduganella lurida]|uniref:Dipeptide epimerase n=1 Tax=Pseudoduganella lurida TaxID=1036180 RepID=A0A562RJI6_9BURK|nr:dipeptide epimerase [Pseudoduganella lurida]TWI69218.1 L-alanine-DL-glutamate epimerase-like enolase superfamily enzyme [Pseudoduganella lurida]
MARLTMDVAAEGLRLAQPFRIAGYLFERFDVVVVTLRDGHHTGRGEGGGVYYLGDDVPHMLAELERSREVIEAGPDRDTLRTLMPPGGARNAVDCALWDLEAARCGMPVWQLAGLPPPRALRTTFTLGANEPALMAEAAALCTQAQAIKIKLTGDLPLDLARVAAIRAARPEVWLGVDGNQGYQAADLDDLVAGLLLQRVALLEQPLARGREAELQHYRSPIPIAGDESILTLADVPGAVGRFDVVNIKLDKCGGLTEALLMADEARRLGLGVMVGNMGGSSLAMGPGFVLGQRCDIVDLDGPTFLANDRSPAVDYVHGNVWAPGTVWGGGVLA